VRRRSQVLEVMVDLDIAGLRSAIQRSYPREQLDVEADAGRLVLTGTASDAHIVEDLSKMAGAYSAEVVNSVRVPMVHERQVLLEVRFVEVDRTALSQLGFNILSTGAGKTIGTTTTGQYGGFGPWDIKGETGVGSDQICVLPCAKQAARVVGPDPKSLQPPCACPWLRTPRRSAWLGPIQTRLTPAPAHSPRARTCAHQNHAARAASFHCRPIRKSE